MEATVDSLLLEHFSKRSKEDQVKVVTEGRPRPRLHRLVLGDDGILKAFDVSVYDKEEWLCGCNKRDGLFCWMCLLFVMEGSQWNISGFYDFKDLDTQMQKHKKSVCHFNGMLQYHIFLKENFLASITTDTIQKNIYIKKNLEVLKRIIDVVCVMVSQASPPHKRTNQRNLLKPTVCVKLLTLLKTYDNHDIVDEAITLIQNCPKVVTDIVEAIARLMKLTMKKEAKFSTFVTLILSDHLDVEIPSKLSTVVRYVKDGQIYERFLGFTNLNADKTNLIIQKHVENVIAGLEITNKLLAVSTDGAVPTAKYMYYFLNWLRRNYPQTLYVPCHFHDFNFVLQQTLSQFPECALFFKYVNSIKVCFQSNPRMCTAFWDSAGKMVPDLANLKLTNSQFLRVLKMHRGQFVKFFKSLSHRCDKWSKEEIVKAVGFQKVLEEYQTVFLLETFFQLFQHTAFLSETLSSARPDVAFESCVSDQVIAALKNEKHSGFERFWTLALAEIIEDDKLQIPNSAGEEETQRLFQLFLKIVDRLIQDVQLRLACVKKLAFLGIFDRESRGRLVASDYHLSVLVDSQSPYFDQYQLKSEIKVFNKYGWVADDKSVSDLLEFLRRKNLHAAFKNLFKLAEFIVTLPCKPASVANSSKFDSINAWASFSETAEMDGLSLLCVEHEVLEYLQSQIQFYDEVILQLNSLRN